MTDMNAAYFQLTKRVLPNAKVVIDRFHIIKHLNQAFNDFRVQEMKKITSVGATTGSRESEKELALSSKTVKKSITMITKHGAVFMHLNTRYSLKQ